MDKVIDEEKIFRTLDESSIETITDDLRENKLVMMLHKSAVKAGIGKDASRCILQIQILEQYGGNTEKELVLEKVALDLLFSMIDLKLRAEYEAEKGEEKDED